MTFRSRASPLNDSIQFHRIVRSLAAVLSSRRARVFCHSISVTPPFFTRSPTLFFLRIRKMPTIKLSYFPFGGRALTARLAFAIGNVAFEDERVGSEDWQAHCGDRVRFPLGAMPVLTVDGRVYTQSHAINKFVGAVSGLGAADPLDDLAIDQAFATLEEIYSGDKGFTSTMFIENADAKKAARLAFLDENLRFHCRRMVTLLEQSGTGFIGKKLSVADLNLVAMMVHMSSGHVDHVPVTIFDDEFPKLSELKKRVLALPAVAAFLHSHPDG